MAIINILVTSQKNSILAYDQHFTFHYCNDSVRVKASSLLHAQMEKAIKKKLRWKHIDLIFHNPTRKYVYEYVSLLKNTFTDKYFTVNLAQDTKTRNEAKED